MQVLERYGPNKTQAPEFRVAKRGFLISDQRRNWIKEESQSSKMPNNESIKGVPRDGKTRA